MLKLTDKLDLRRGQKTIALSNLSIYYTWKNIKSSYNNNKFKISAPTWSEEFELLDGSYSISDIHDYFEYIKKKHSESVDNPSIIMYINRIENRITFKIKNGYYLELLTPETMKLLGSTESKITKNKNGENVPHLEVVELVLVHYSLVNNDYQQDSRILFTFVPSKSFGSLLEISPTNHRDINLVTTNKKRRKLVSEPNYHTMNYISKDLSIIEMNKMRVKMNKPIYLGLSILDISKIVMYEFWYDYMKPKYGNDVKLYYMDTDSFVMNIKKEDFYKDLAYDVDKRFDTSNYEVDRPLPTGKNKKVIGLMKDELGGKLITEFITLRPKAYTYLTDDGKEDKKAKGTKKKCVIKRMIKFDDYKRSILNGEVILKSQERFRSKGHDVYTENINKIALNNNDDKRLIALDKSTSYPYVYKDKDLLV